MKLIDKYLDQIDESKRTTITKVTRQTKIKKATGQLATIKGKKLNDPMYKQMLYYREKYYHYRDMLHKKYGPRVRAQARR